MRSVQSTLFTLLAASRSAHADVAFNLTPGVSPISHDIYELHMIIFWVCVAIGVVVFGVMFYAMFHFRQSRGVKAKQIHSQPWLEIAWTIVPLIILVLMAIPATRVLLNMNDVSKEDITIKITGYQWRWHYEYIEDGVSFFSNLSTPYQQLHNLAPKGKNYLREVDHPLVIPIHKKIRFLVTSNDVNHSWWVPELGVKRDAIAGFINEAWTRVDKPGTYVGQCAELCGVNHAFMPIVVVATTEQGYQDWLAQQKKGGNTAAVAAAKPSATVVAPVAAAPVEKISPEDALKAAMTRGEKVYLGICSACHQPSGMGVPPTFPALKGGKIVTGPVAAHIHQVLYGKQGTAMQAFKDILNDQEIADVITYERNAWGNNDGKVVTPEDIKAARQQN